MSRIVAGAVFGAVFASSIALAWSGPSAAAPGGNVAMPVGVGATNQVKDATISVNGISVFGNTLLNPNSYLNFGVTAGETGYGTRDKGGILEFKNATGTWQSIQSIISTLSSSSTAWSTGAGSAIYRTSGVAIGTSVAPVAALDVIGFARLAPRAAAPVACDSAHTGSVAIANGSSHLCVCNGSAWVFDYNGAACAWDTVPDTIPPSVAVSSPTNGSTVSGTVTVSANASDNAVVVGVQFKLDGANLGAEDMTAPYSVSWNTATVANGSHTLTAVARDAAGNQATSAAIGVTTGSRTNYDGSMQ